jgi:hypothetical protein
MAITELVACVGVEDDTEQAGDSEPSEASRARTERSW